MERKEQSMSNLFFNLVTTHLIYNYDQIPEIMLITEVDKENKIIVTESFYNILLIEIKNKNFIIFNASIYKFINTNFETRFFSLHDQERAGIILGVEKMPSHMKTLTDFIKKSFRGQIKISGHKEEISLHH